MVDTVDDVTREYTLSKDVADILEYEADSRDIPQEQILKEWLKDGYWLAYSDTEETVVKLKHIDPWQDSNKNVDSPTKDGDTPQTLKTFRRLRDEFPAVTAGIDYSKAFTGGGGFTVEIDDKDDKAQVESKRTINDFNRTVFQDSITVGLDALLDTLLDEAFTVGTAYAEIVYEEQPQFGTYASKVSRDNTTEPEYEVRDPEDTDWKSYKGIAQLKFIDNGVERIKAYRNPQTYKIEYWTVDEKDAKDKDGNPIEVPKLLPWQLLVLSWGRRGSGEKGTSLIRPAAETAVLLEDIFKAVGTSFKRWSDRKYFFILGDARTGRSWAPPRITQFMKDTKNMIDTGASAVPVQGGFDIKDIGGEAYDGSNVIDRLISLICGGMRYPRTFLEQGKSFEGDKAWLAWITTYAGHQKLLRRAIEHQLWERQLYCKYGTKRRLSVQGKKLEDQEVVPVYVPRMAWKSEGKWHTEQKLKQLTGILNVANPVGGELKIEVEQDIATTLGYSDFDLENARKVLDVNQKLEVVSVETEMIKAEILKDVFEKAQEDEMFMKEDFIPILQGLQKKEEPEEVANPKRPPPVPLKRLAGGVSRQSKATGDPNKGELSKKMGGTRKPSNAPSSKRVQETEEEEPVVEFETYGDMLRTFIAVEDRERKNDVYQKMINILDKM